MYVDMQLGAYYQNVMTAKEMQIAIDRIGCSGAALARWLSVKPETVSRWRNGMVAIPGPAALAIKALASGWRPN